MLPKKNAFHAVLFAGVILISSTLVGCSSGQRNFTLDAAPADVANVKSVAIASITARPSESLEMLPYQQGAMVRVLTKFENELFTYMLQHGFNVVNPAVSRVAYAHETDYEDLYIANSPEILTNVQNPNEFKFLANNMKKLAHLQTQKPAATFTSLDSEPSQYNLMPTINRTPTINQGMPNVVTSMNTRIFEQLEFGSNISSPTMTVLGGADDNRWQNSAMRRGIGEITRRIGADAALVIDGHLHLTPRLEGALVAGVLGGGTRRVEFEGTATMIRSDGAIISVESFQAFSEDTISGTTKIGQHERTFSGLARFENNEANINDLTMQAVRRAADMISETYGKYGASTGESHGAFDDIF